MMTSIYNSATVCPYNKQNCSANSPDRLSLDPQISDRFAKSRDYDELKYLWVEWRESTGKLMRSNYETYVDLMNRVAVGNNYTDASLYWQSDFEEPHFEEMVDNLWLDVEPLYDQLHTYMRYKLIAIYGETHSI